MFCVWEDGEKPESRSSLDDESKQEGYGVEVVGEEVGSPPSWLARLSPPRRALFFTRLLRDHATLISTPITTISFEVTKSRISNNYMYEPHNQLNQRFKDGSSSEEGHPPSQSRITRPQTRKTAPPADSSSCRGDCHMDSSPCSRCDADPPSLPAAMSHFPLVPLRARSGAQSNACHLRLSLSGIP